MKAFDIVFDRPIRDPHTEGEHAQKVDRLRQAKGREFTVTEDGPWLHIKGERRTVTVLRARVVDVLGYEDDSKPVAQAQGKR